MMDGADWMRVSLDCYIVAENNTNILKKISFHLFPFIVHFLAGEDTIHRVTCRRGFRQVLSTVPRKD